MLKSLLTLAFISVASTTLADGGHGHGAGATAHSDMAMSTGKITKVDTKWNRLTIDHGPLENLGMEAMTMVFEVADPAMLDGLAEGQDIAFSADRVKGKLTVTAIGE